MGCSEEGGEGGGLRRGSSPGTTRPPEGGGWLECDQEKRGTGGEDGERRGGAQGDDAEEDEVNRMGRCIWGCKGRRGGGLGLWFVAVAEAVPVTAAPPVPQLATNNTSTKYRHEQHRRGQQA